MGSPMLKDTQSSLQHAGPQLAVLQLQQEVTSLKARFKPTWPKKSGIDGWMDGWGSNQVTTFLDK